MFVFAHTKNSRRLIKIKLSHCSHLDYFNKVFNNFQSLILYVNAFWSMKNKASVLSH